MIWGPLGFWARLAHLGLAGLLVVPCLGLVWPGPVLPALPWPGPATTTGRLRRPAAAAPPLLLLLDQAKARRARQARQGQARASQGKAQQASQPSQGDVLVFLTHRHMVGKSCKIMKSGMNQVQVCRFRLVGGGGIGLLNPPGRPATEKHRKHVQNLHFSRFLGPKWVEKKVEIEGVGPIWRAPGRNSASRRA